MSRAIISWYTLAAVVVLGPAGLRMAYWPKHQPQTVDVSEAAAGKKLFMHEWTVNDPLSGGDGLGPVFNAKFRASPAITRAASAAAAGSSTTSPASSRSRTDAARSPRVSSTLLRQDPAYQENLAHIHDSLPPISQPTLAVAAAQQGGRRQSQQQGRLQDRVAARRAYFPAQHAALFGAKLIDDIPDRAIIALERNQKVRWGGDVENSPVGRAMRHKDGKIGKFGWKAQSISLIDFVEAACANELGLGNPGGAQPTPLSNAAYRSTGVDLSTKQCQQMAAFILTLPKPIEAVPDNPRDVERATHGKGLFKSVGCADCHVPNVESAKGIYSDLLMHKMGRDLEGIGGYNAPPSSPDNPDGTTPDEWRTPPLWGVADSAPYLHDGGAATLEDAIRLHGGQAHLTAERFQKLAPRDRNDLVFFLKTLQAPR